ncbi:MAG TPA: T9SS type A sorting domain-containing protein [Chitinophagaceae bacterium]|jgi:hypothetical protein|nr:T9SS type A sorting domain-containing protein [Chitinophagaceae bacterium]
MKRFYKTAGNFFLLSFLFIGSQAKAQHVPGDIAFTGYHCQSVDVFSFVLLKTFTAGQTINFTDASWLTATNNFDSDEGMITWTVPAGGLVVGREVTINCATNTATLLGAGNPGTVAVVTVALNFNTSGDQLFAFSGPLAAPTSVLSGINMNVLSVAVNFDACTTDNAVWDGTCATGNNSYTAKPSGPGNLTLTTGTNALWIGTTGAGYVEWDNARFNCASVPAASLATVAGVRAAVNNKANWTTNSDAVPSATIPLPAGCQWLGLTPLPVKLESFTGKLNADKSATLNWKVSEQQNVREYVVEESIDGLQFSQTGAALASATENYSLNDPQMTTGINYYRLRIVDQDGRETYSNIIMLTLKAGIKINVYPNPVTDKLTIQQFGNTKNTTATLSDGHGKILQQVKITEQNQVISMETYPAGMYILKMEDGTVFKVMKQ